MQRSTSRYVWVVSLSADVGFCWMLTESQGGVVHRYDRSMLATGGF